MCAKNFKPFHTFIARKRRVECKKITCLATKGRGLLPRNLETHARKVCVAEIWNHQNVPRSNISRVLSVRSCRYFEKFFRVKLTQKTENNAVGRFGWNLDSKFYVRKQFFRTIGEIGRSFGLEVIKISKFIRFPSVYKNSLPISGLVCHCRVHWSAWKINIDEFRLDRKTVKFVKNRWNKRFEKFIRSPFV